MKPRLLFIMIILLSANCFAAATHITNTDMTIDDVYVANSIGIGVGTTNTALDVVVSSGGAARIGSSGNSATGTESVAIGHSAQATGDYSIAMGYYCQAGGLQSIALGPGSQTGAYGALAMSGGKATGQFSRVSGPGLEVSGDFSHGIALANMPNQVLSQDNTLAIMGGPVGIGTVVTADELEVNGTGYVYVRTNTVTTEDAGYHMQAQSTPEGQSQYAVAVEGSTGDFFIAEDYQGGVWNPVKRLIIQDDTGNVEIDSLKGSYTGGQAYVCVNNSGVIFASETPC